MLDLQITNQYNRNRADRHDEISSRLMRELSAPDNSYTTQRGPTGPGSSWVADICEANNGDNYNATTGARVTHTGYGSSTLQFTAVPGPDRTWRISKLTQLPGSCAT
jgi:hypothetical protein